MLFNSYEFAIFLPIVFIIYWFFIKEKLAIQNKFLLLTSYVFYSFWDWRFLFLLLFSTLLDYYTGIKMSDKATSQSRKFWFWLSIIVNLGFLGIFKYYNFFAESFVGLFSSVGISINPGTINVILPVGISFYTFHGISYVIDIYKRRISPEKNFVDYALFVSFFPLLVAGPIERATHLLPQLKKERKFEYAQAVDGMRQILWGLFKKVVIADNCAEYANLIFENYTEYSGSTLFLGILFFSFQIYGDFSGYSDIAIGTAKLFGIELLKNFSFPYFSRDIAEFWRRWHISLSTWFRDYLYIPLGGSRGTAWKNIRNIFIIFIVSGFWHGANWTFIFWGILNALYFLPLLLSKKNRQNLDIVAQGKMLPSLKELLSMGSTFLLTMFAWVFFRSDTVKDAFYYIKKLFSASLFSKPDFYGMAGALVTIVLIILFIIAEWLGRADSYAIQRFGISQNKFFRYTFYYIIVVMIFLFAGKEQNFIYFQF